ncbi:hypothetical protein SLE2022_315390 [Rubroshorea leprosula]
MLLFFLFLSILHLGITHLEARKDKEGLLYFKSQLIDPQNALTGWTNNTSHCTWNGVLCNKNGTSRV